MMSQWSSILSEHPRVYGRVSVRDDTRNGNRIVGSSELAGNEAVPLEDLCTHWGMVFQTNRHAHPLSVRRMRHELGTKHAPCSRLKVSRSSWWRCHLRVQQVFVPRHSGLTGYLPDRQVQSLDAFDHSSLLCYLVKNSLTASATN